jgi:hypothetical protein
VLGNWSGVGSSYPSTQGNNAAQAPNSVTFDTIVKYGNGISNTPFAGATGLMTVTSNANIAYPGISGGVLTGASNTYSVTNISTSHGNNTVPISDGSGNVDVTALKVNGTVAITAVSGTSLNIYTPGYTTSPVIQTTGTTSGNATITMPVIVDNSAGTLYASKIYASNTLSSTAAGSITGAWTLNGTWQATYADLAEKYEGDAEYEPGTVVVFGGEKEVTVTSTVNDTRLAGVVSTEPAYIMNGEQKGIAITVALAGRVPCKVVGKVKKGDMLTTAGMLGYACKAVSPTLGAIIGKALEDKDYSEAGVIEVAVGRN